mmetsp:Transcript_101157/g.286750  ORF Transcript_101157/g.286750 Transcript_101157/m.286750 type:complete len:236 (+) Transcript_101157:146-853(+)
MWCIMCGKHCPLAARTTAAMRPLTAGTTPPQKSPCCRSTCTAWSRSLRVRHAGLPARTAWSHTCQDRNSVVRTSRRFAGSGTTPSCAIGGRRSRSWRWWSRSRPGARRTRARVGPTTRRSAPARTSYFKASAKRTGRCSTRWRRATACGRSCRRWRRCSGGSSRSWSTRSSRQSRTPKCASARAPRQGTRYRGITFRPPGEEGHPPTFCSAPPADHGRAAARGRRRPTTARPEFW